MGKKKTAAQRKKQSSGGFKSLKPDAFDPSEMIDAPPLEKRVFLPGMEARLQEEHPDDEEGGWELEPDMSAYVMLRSMQTEWPCLSFDLLRDGGGEERTGFPMTSYMVSGTQPEHGKDARLLVMRTANLCKNQREAAGEDSDDESDDEADEADDETRRPHFTVASIAHPGGCVNRVRTMAGHPSALTATWSESGAVQVWALAEAYRLLESTPAAGTDKTYTLDLQPIGAVQHRAEGYALDWARGEPRLLAGDCQGRISLSVVDPNGGVQTDRAVFTGHAGSVEDLQWSPTETTVFASCSVDGTVRLWDTRADRATAALTIAASAVDVNVVSWNRQLGHLLASGHDDGQFATWDLRSPAAPVFRSDWHRAAITSIEWNPTDASVLAVAGADDQVTLWDLAVEEDGERDEELASVPPQLLFIHQGQRDVKEVHWHPQLAGVLVSTSGSGFNIFKTISV